MPKFRDPLQTVEGDRLHERIFHLQVLCSAVGVSVLAATGATQLDWDKKASLTLRANVFDLNLHFSLYLPIQGAAAGMSPEKIIIPVEEIPPRVPYQGRIPAIPLILSYIITPIFVDFVEDHKQWLADQNIKRADWPGAFLFGCVIRNSMSHGGRIWMTDKKAKPVHWHHLHYDVADHGKVAYGNATDLWVADVILLMFDMSAELDRLGCPAVFS
jgi:hypothetical protein